MDIRQNKCLNNLKIKNTSQKKEVRKKGENES